MAENMKYFLIGLVIGLVLFIIGRICFPKEVFVDRPVPYQVTVKEYIKGDTVIDTVKNERKGTAKVIPVPKATQVPVDTVIVAEGAVIALYSEDVVTKPIQVDYSFKCDEVHTLRVDTVKVPYPVEVKVLEARPWYDHWETGAAAAGMLAVIIAIVSR